VHRFLPAGGADFGLVPQKVTVTGGWGVDVLCETVTPAEPVALRPSVSLNPMLPL